MAGLKNKFELADVIRKFGKKLVEQHHLSPQQTKALNNILQCRTASLGGHEEACEHCGITRYSYNSCGDRHCPKCGGTKQAIWIENLQKFTLPVNHYHIIFTVPHSLNNICLWDKSMYYNILFSAVWKTLYSFGYTHYGVETGAVAILHSWGQNLSLHPHIHCIVPAVGYNLMGNRKNIGKNGRYLYPVHQLSNTFKGKFLDSLKRNLIKTDKMHGFAENIQTAYKKQWVVYSEAPLAQAETVIRYLGQYTHRVAIANHRILNISNTHVTFIAKDYRDRALKKPVTLQGVEFLRRFCLHIFPKQFVRIRRYGIYNPTTIKSLDLQFVPQKKPDIPQSENTQNRETHAERIIRLTGFDVGLCPVCKKGRMLVIREIPRIRSPVGNLQKNLFALLT